MQLIVEILIPSAMPSILHGFRTALGLGWVLLIVAEVIASTEGLGWIIWDSRQYGRADEMIAGMIAIGATGALTDWCASMIQRRLLFWSRTFEGQ